MLKNLYVWVIWSAFMWFGAIGSWEYFKPGDWFMISCDSTIQPFTVLSKDDLMAQDFKCEDNNAEVRMIKDYDVRATLDGMPNE